MPGLIPHLSFLVNRHMFGQLRMIWRGRRRCWWLCHSVALRARFAHRFAIQWEQTKNTISDFLKLFNIQSYPIISNHIQSYPIISNLTLFHMAFLWQKSHHFREAMGDDFTRAQLATYARVVPDMDVIITTAMIPNRSAPELITAEMVVPHLISLLFVDRNG